MTSVEIGLLVVRVVASVVRVKASRVSKSVAQPWWGSALPNFDGV